MSVLLPAPFSPRSAWISPGSTTRSMESFAVKEPKRLVTPRSSSPTDALRSLPLDGVPTRPRVDRRTGGREGEYHVGHSPAPLRCRSTDRPGSLRLAGRGDLDLAGGEVLFGGVELALHVGRHLAVELVERGQAGPTVAQVADVVPGREAPVRGLGDVGRHRVAEVLGDAGEEVLAVLLRAHEAVRVDPDPAVFSPG